MDTEIIIVGPQDAAIAQMAEQYLPLKINGVDDKEGYEAVHQARMLVVRARTTTDKKRAELKKEALEYGRKVDSEAKRIFALLEPIETHLSKEEDAYNAAKEAIKNAARLKAEAEAKAAQEAEQARIKDEQDAENARLAAEREKLAEQQRQIDAQRAQQKAEQDKIDTERRKIEEEKARLERIEANRLHAIEVEKAKAEAAERSRIETEARLKREEQQARYEAQARKEAEEAARIKAESLRPDRAKLLIVASCVAGIVVPEVSPAAQAVAVEIEHVLNAASQRIRGLVNAAMPEVAEASTTDDLNDLI